MTRQLLQTGRLIVVVSSFGLAFGCRPSPATQESQAEVPGDRQATPRADDKGHDHHMHHGFKDAEQWAKQFDDPSRDAWQKPEAVLDFVAPAPDAVVVDLGAGTGYFAVRFAKRVVEGKVFANDVEPDMVRYLGERAQREGLDNMVPVLGKANDAALVEPVDVAFMCNVFHHLAEPAAFFAKVVAKLKPGGRVVIVDFKKDAPTDIPGPPPKMRVAQADLVEQLGAVGLRLARAERELLPYQYIVELTAGSS